MSFSIVGMGTLLANVSLLSVITTENVLYTESSLRMSACSFNLFIFYIIGDFCR